jgi:hypothetical protein
MTWENNGVSGILGKRLDFDDGPSGMVALGGMKFFTYP